MKFFKNLKDKSVKTGKRMFAYDQVSQGFREQQSIVKEMYNYNMKEIIPEEENFQIPIQNVIAAHKAFKRLFVTFIALFVFALIYVLSALLTRNWIVAILAFAFSILCLSLAFRYHFWLYQMKRKTLGLSFADYYRDEIAPLFKTTKRTESKKEGK